MPSTSPDTGFPSDVAPVTAWIPQGRGLFVRASNLRPLETTGIRRQAEGAAARLFFAVPDDAPPLERNALGCNDLEGPVLAHRTADMPVCGDLVVNSSDVSR